jgi:hypothetical protein
MDLPNLCQICVKKFSGFFQAFLTGRTLGVTRIAHSLDVRKAGGRIGSRSQKCSSGDGQKIIGGVQGRIKRRTHRRLRPRRAGVGHLLIRYHVQASRVGGCLQKTASRMEAGLSGRRPNLAGCVWLANVTGLLSRRSGCRAGQHDDAPRIVAGSLFHFSLCSALSGAQSSAMKKPQFTFKKPHGFQMKIVWASFSVGTEIKRVWAGESSTP